MSELQGRRVEGWNDLEKPGDYSFHHGVLWFILPTGSMGRIAAKGHGQPGDPEWDITEEPDGSVTVDPSIEQHAIEGPHPVPYWHGHLRRGVWT